MAVSRFAQRSPTRPQASTGVPTGGIRQARSCARPSALMFFAALTSRSWTVPHRGQVQVLSFGLTLSWICPQAEQVRVVGEYRSAASRGLP